MRILVAALCLLSVLLAAPLQAGRTGSISTPRVAVISAFEPEWKTLKAAVEGPKSFTVNGVEFVTGTLGGRPVVLFLSGISMVNASMTTQLALDRFDITGIVVSGIAGGIDPSLHVGDVVVAGRWGQYLEAAFAREADGKFQPPPFIKTPFANYGMIFPTETEVRSAKAGPESKRFCQFEADAGMMAAAGKIGAVPIEALHLRSGVPARSAAPGRRRQRRVGPGLRRQRRLPAIRVRDLQGAGGRHGDRGRGHGRLRQRRAFHRLPLPVRPRRRRPCRTPTR